MKNKTVLLAGFEPFNHAAINPAWEAVRLFGRSTDEGYQTKVLKLPCVFGEAIETLTRAVDQHNPDLVIVVGQASGRPGISVERVAINVDDASIRDNAGRQPVDIPVVAGGPAAYFSTLPIKAIVRALRGRGLVAGVSQTAGTFVCNHVFYGLMNHVAERGLKAGFIHVPLLPEQAAAHPDKPVSMRLEDIVASIEIAVTVALAQEHDVVESGGATH